MAALIHVDGSLHALTASPRFHLAGHRPKCACSENVQPVKRTVISVGVGMLLYRISARTQYSISVQTLDEASGGNLDTESEGSDSDSDSSASDLSLA